MLPDVSKRRMLYGYARKDYDSKKLKSILDWECNDGVTTDNCVDIVKRMNGYLEKSRYLVVEASAIFLFLKDLLDSKYADSECEIIKLYNENASNGLLGGAVKNMMKIIKSVASQRNLIRKVKPVIKVNRISYDWDGLLNCTLDAMERRINYLKTIIIPANMENTPMDAYIHYLEEKNIDIFDDINAFIKNNGSIYDKDDTSAEKYKEHVMRILCDLDSEIADQLVEDIRRKSEVLNKRIEESQKEKKAESMSAKIAGIEECKGQVLSMCSDAAKTFRKMRKSSLEYRAKTCADVWVVPAAAMSPRRYGYLKKAGSNRFSISSVMNGTIFNTEEEAKKAAKLFCRATDEHVAEVAKVELYSYGIGM